MVKPPEEEIALKYHLSKLRSRQQSVETQIRGLQHHPTVEDIRVHRLEKEKRHLRDEITRLQNMLEPDIIA